MIIQIETIPHYRQRYPTCGDYFTDQMGVQQIRVSDTGKPDYSFLIALHEMIEAYLCFKRGITDQSIDAFDREFENHRNDDEIPNDAEPGDHPDAPYYREHQFATAVERLMAVELGVNWNAYDDTITRLK